MCHQAVRVVRTATSKHVTQRRERQAAHVAMSVRSKKLTTTPPFSHSFIPQGHKRVCVGATAKYQLEGEKHTSEFNFVGGASSTFQAISRCERSRTPWVAVGASSFELQPQKQHRHMKVLQRSAEKSVNAKHNGHFTEKIAVRTPSEGEKHTTSTGEGITRKTTAQTRFTKTPRL